jgi:uncharacterized membrane protein
MKNITSLNRATIVTIISIVILTIWAELSVGFKNLLTSMTGHHWTTKSLLAIAIFFLVYILGKKSKDQDIQKTAINTLTVTILGSLVIFLFYVYEFFK